MSRPATRVSRSSRVWVTRTRPGAERTGAHLSALGFTPLIAPLLDIHPLDVTPDLTGIQAMAFTSRNGVAAFVARSPARPRPLLEAPVFAVGDGTAEAAREAGFTDVRSARGDLAALATLIRAEAAGLSILHPCAARPAGDLAAMVGDAARVSGLAIYEARETGLDAPEAWDIVMIHSPRAARALAARLPAEAASGRIACTVSANAAEPISGFDFAEIRIADAPDENGLLATLGKRGVSV